MLSNKARLVSALAVIVMLMELLMAVPLIGTVVHLATVGGYVVVLLILHISILSLRLLEVDNYNQVLEIKGSSVRYKTRVFTPIIGIIVSLTPWIFIVSPILHFVVWLLYLIEVLANRHTKFYKEKHIIHNELH